MHSDQAKWEQILEEHGLGLYQGVGHLIYVSDYDDRAKPFHYSMSEKLRLRIFNPKNAERLRKLRKEHPELTRRYRNDYRRRKREAICSTN